MICTQHEWWAVETWATCPKCAEAVTAPVTNSEPVSDVERAAGAPLEIPDFLVRNRDGTFAHPEAMDPMRAMEERVAALPGAEVHLIDPVRIEQWTDNKLLEALESPCYTRWERQPIYLELRRREDKKKSHARIAEMKAKKEAAQ